MVLLRWAGLITVFAENKELAKLALKARIKIGLRQPTAIRVRSEALCGQTTATIHHAITAWVWASTAEY